MQQKDVVELYGEEGTGKTEMLLHLVARCLLPPKWKDVEVGGLNAGVLLVDTDYHFSIVRLVSVMEHRVRKMLVKYKKQNLEASEMSDIPSHTDKDIGNIIKQALEKFHVVKCNTSTQFVFSLNSLDSVFGNKPDICLLAIDSISSFYWIDRSNGAENFSAQESNQRRICHAINKLREDYNIVTVVTKPAIFRKKPREKTLDKSEVDHSPFRHSSNSADTNPGYCEYMCKLWQRLVTHRFLFSKEHIITESKTGGTKEADLFTVACGTSGEAVNRKFYITEFGVLFMD